MKCVTVTGLHDIDEYIQAQLLLAVCTIVYFNIGRVHKVRILLLGLTFLFINQSELFFHGH